MILVQWQCDLLFIVVRVVNSVKCYTYSVSYALNAFDMFVPDFVLLRQIIG
jgi:hypothetical protein